MTATASRRDHGRDRRPGAAPGDASPWPARETAAEQARRTVVVTVYSWAGGTGRTLTVAGLGVLLAARGLRVGLLDANLAAPGLHAQFDLPPAAEHRNLADYLFGADEIETVGYDVGPVDGAGPGGGALVLVPCRLSNTDELGEALARHVDLGLLADGIERLIQQCALDVLLVDTQNGVGRSALVPLLAADVQLLLVTGSSSEREGMHSLGPLLAGPEHALVVQAASAAAVVVGQVRGIPVATTLPHAAELVRGNNAARFLREYPSHPLTQRLTELADHIENRLALTRLLG